MVDYIAADYDKLLSGTTFEIKSKRTTNSKNLAQEKLDDIEKYTVAVAAYANYDVVNHNADETPFQTLAKSMLDLIADGKIKKCIVQEGYGAEPAEDDTVKINYNAYVEYEPIPFDSTYARKQPLKFVMKDADVIEGLLLAVQSMKLCEKSQFLIAPELAYRDCGYGRIPANSTVLFEIELNDVNLTPTDENKKDKNGERQSDFPEIYKECKNLAKQGKESFRKGNIRAAIKEYHLAIRKLEAAVLADYQDQITYDVFLMRLLSNLVVCFAFTNEPKRGCAAANKAYQLARNKNVSVPVKVYYNNAKCIRLLGDYDQAEHKLIIAMKMDPDNYQIREEYEDLLNERREKCKQLEANNTAI